MMKKTFTSTLTVIFALVFVASLSSADVFNGEITSVPTSVNQDAGSFQIIYSITYTGAAEGGITVTSSNEISVGSVTGTTFNPVNPVSLIKDETKSITATITFPSGQSGSIGGQIVADPSGSASSVTLPYSVQIIEPTPNPSLTITKITDITKTQSGSIKVKNNGNVPLNNIQLKSSGDFNVEFSSDNFNLAVEAEQIVNVEQLDLGEVGLGGKSITVTATSDETTSNLVLTVAGSFCKNGEQGGNLSIRKVRIDNKGEGKDDEWKLLDIIEVEVEVENNGDDDIQDVFVEIGLFDKDGRNVIRDVDFDSSDEEQIDLGRIRNDDKDTTLFRFVVPADFEDGSYKLAVKVYSDDIRESNECADRSSYLSDTIYEKIDVERESDVDKFIVFKNMKIIPTELTCGERVTFTADVYNIGDEDQDKVKVRIYNAELGIENYIEIRSGLDQGDKEAISFEFVIPAGIEDGIYSLFLSSEYDYKNGEYRESSGKEDYFDMRVIGCAISRFVLIEAKLDSDAKAGEELIITSTITNLGSESKEFSLELDGYNSWAELESISDEVFSLDAGESKKVTLKFNVNADSEGENNFDIQVSSGGRAEEKRVVVNIERKGFAGFDLGDNALIWVIGIINVILVLLIILVAVRISRR